MLDKTIEMSVVHHLFSIIKILILFYNPHHKVILLPLLQSDL